MFQIRQPLRTLSGNEIKEPFLVFDETTTKPPMKVKKAPVVAYKAEAENVKRIYRGIIRMQNVLIMKLQKKVSFLTFILQCKRISPTQKVKTNDDDSLLLPKKSPVKPPIVTPKKRRYDDPQENMSSQDEVQAALNFQSPPRTRSIPIPSTPPSGAPQAGTPSSHNRLRIKKSPLISSQLHSFNSPPRPEKSAQSPATLLERTYSVKQSSQQRRDLTGNMGWHSTSHLLPDSPEQLPHQDASKDLKQTSVPSAPDSGSSVQSLEARLQLLENSIRLLAFNPIPYAMAKGEVKLSGDSFQAPQASNPTTNRQQDPNPPPGAAASNPAPFVAKKEFMSSGVEASNAFPNAVPPIPCPQFHASTQPSSESLFPPTRSAWKPLQFEFDTFSEAVAEATEISKRTLLRDSGRISGPSSARKSPYKTSPWDYPSFAKDLHSRSGNESQLASLGEQCGAAANTYSFVPSASGSISKKDNPSQSPIVALPELTLLQDKMSTWKQQYSVSSTLKTGDSKSGRDVGVTRIR